MPALLYTYPADIIVGDNKMSEAEFNWTADRIVKGMNISRWNPPTAEQTAEIEKRKEEAQRVFQSYVNGNIPVIVEELKENNEIPVEVTVSFPTNTNKFSNMDVRNASFRMEGEVGSHKISGTSSLEFDYSGNNRHWKASGGYGRTSRSKNVWDALRNAIMYAVWNYNKYHDMYESQDISKVRQTELTEWAKKHGENPSVSTTGSGYEYIVSWYGEGASTKRLTVRYGQDGPKVVKVEENVNMTLDEAMQ